MWWRWLGLVLVLGMMGVACAGEITDPALLALLQNAPTAADYPDEDAVWLLRSMEVTIEPSGAFTVREHKVAKILTTQGASLAQWEIPYDKASETLTVRTAQTLYNGQAFPADPAQVVENSVYPGLAWYDSMMVRRFPLPSALPGAVLDVETDHQHTMPRVPGAFSTRLYLRQQYPVYEARYLLRVPADQRLSIRFTGDDAPKVEETLEGDCRVYRWSLQHLPGLKLREPQLPPVDDIIPSIHITSLSSWEPVVAWYQRITQGKDAVTPDLRQVALDRTAGCTSPEAKIAALHKAVREIPYVALEMGELSDVPHSAEEVARQNYGDCKDKATLLRALLHAIEIPADYVLVRTTNRGRLDREQYGADEFNHVMLAVTLPNGDRFLDPTIADSPADHLPPGVDGADGLIIRGKGEVVSLPASTTAENTTDIRIQVTVRDNGSATGKAVLTFRGTNAILQRGILATVAKDRYRDALEGYLAPRLGLEVAIDAVTVDGVKEPERPLVLTAQFSSPTYVQPAGDQLSGSLPCFTYQPNTYRTTKERLYPFSFDTESSLHQETTITLPKTLQVSHLPSPVRFTGKVGSYQDAAAINKHQITYTCDLIIKRGTFPPETLEDIRKWSAILAQEGRNQLQFFLRRSR